MKSKIYNVLLIITSLIGYLEWSGDSHTFLFQMEADIVYKLFTKPSSVLHPLILIPLAGQLLLIITLFQKQPNKLLIYIGLISLAILLIFMFIVGVISFNYKIILSTIPFIVVSVLTIVHYRRSVETFAN
jgi:hypothetical protein